MNAHIAPILEEARRAPSVLNSQPWRFRVCGNTIEIYLEKKTELAEVDPMGRLQIASCGTLIAHLERSVIRRGLTPKISFFPRFEEPDLVAFMETISASEKQDQRVLPFDTRDQAMDTDGENRDLTGVFHDLHNKLGRLAGSRDVGMIVHDDSTDRSIHTYLRNNCGEKLKSESFRKSLNLYLRTDMKDSKVPYEDEALLSDRFFETESADATGSNGPGFRVNNLFMILTTGTDNRYEWTRAGQALGEIIMELRKWKNIGLMALPIISTDSCRLWLKDKLDLPGFPQFVLKMKPDKPREHVRKRPLQELLKYGF